MISQHSIHARFSQEIIESIEKWSIQEKRVRTLAIVVLENMPPCATILELTLWKASNVSVLQYLRVKRDIVRLLFRSISSCLDPVQCEMTKAKLSSRQM